MIGLLNAIPKDVRPTDRVIHLKTWQDEFILSDARYPALVTPWGCGKTMSGIEKVRLAAENNPNNLILVVRKEFTDLRDSTIKDWNENTEMLVNSSRDAVFPNGSIVMFRHGGELTGDNLSNMNLGAFLIEQAEELDNDETFFRLQGRLRRKGVKHFGAVIANTRGHNWIYRIWKQGKDPQYPLWDNMTSFDMKGIVPDDTLEDWRNLKNLKPEIYQRFVMNSWEIADDAFVVIPSGYVSKSKNLSLPFVERNKKITVCDVAGESEDGDETVIMNFTNTRAQYAEPPYRHQTLMDTVGRIQGHAEEHGSNLICVDRVGLGDGVYSRLAEIYSNRKNMTIYGYDGRISAPPGSADLTYKNYKTYSWFKAAELFKSQVVSIPDDEMLAEELSSVTYRYVGDEIILMQKDKIREKLGRSPDRADCLIMGLDALNRADPVVKRHIERYDDEEEIEATADCL